MLRLRGTRVKGLAFAAPTVEEMALGDAREAMPTKPARIQKYDPKELDRLRFVFAAVLIENIKPHHLHSYLAKRGQAAQT